MPFHNSKNDWLFQELERKYQARREPYLKAMNDLEQAKESIWRTTPIYSFLSWVENLSEFPAVLIFFGMLILLVVSLNYANKGDYGYLVIFGLLLICILTSIIVATKKDHFRNIVLKSNVEILKPYEERAAQAQIQLRNIDQAYNVEWSRACEAYNGYPPDWSKRCEQVKARDGFRCVRCGYPDGFERRSRELHVHHDLPLSEGGTNEISNLITVCHICHRAVDSKHAGVRKLNKITKTRHRFGDIH
jgi:5-methylcytosine-specific restriction endonuclease McrA